MKHTGPPLGKACLHGQCHYTNRTKNGHTLKPFEIHYLTSKTASYRTRMEEVGEKKAKVTKELRENGLANSTETEWIDRHMTDFSIVHVGAARVGKSTLINAEVGKDVAKTSAALDSCTYKISRYTMPVESVELDENGNQHTKKNLIYFYDSPGVENWDEYAADTFIANIVAETNPICLIYCACPTSFAKPKVIEHLLEGCRKQKIFFSLVMTNKFAGTKEQKAAVMDEFRRLLTKVSRKEPQLTHDGILLVSGIGLVTSVNSVHFDNGDGFKRGPEGVNELCLAIMRELDEEKLKGWCLALLDNRSFWTKMGHKISGFFKDKLPKVIRTTATIMRLLTPVYTAVAASV